MSASIKNQQWSAHEPSWFIISFDGPGKQDGRIDVRDLAPALMSLGRIIDAANLAINGEGRPIKARQAMCF